MSITDCITFLVDKLVDVMSSAPVFPFVGFCIAALVIDLIISFLRR